MSSGLGCGILLIKAPSSYALGPLALPSKKFLAYVKGSGYVASRGKIVFFLCLG